MQRLLGSLFCCSHGVAGGQAGADDSSLGVHDCNLVELKVTCGDAFADCKGSYVNSQVIGQILEQTADAQFATADLELTTSLYTNGVTGDDNGNLYIDALKTDDFVYVHVEAPDEAGHEGNFTLKNRTVEDLDSRLIGPIYEEVSKWSEPVAIAVLPDHPTPCAHRTHTSDPIPFLIYAPGLEPDGVTAFDEESCKQGGYGNIEGTEFTRIFLSLK